MRPLFVEIINKSDVIFFSYDALAARGVIMT